jgi:hypothetical protein
MDKLQLVEKLIMFTFLVSCRPISSVKCCATRFSQFWLIDLQPPFCFISFLLLLSSFHSSPFTHFLICFTHCPNLSLSDCNSAPNHHSSSSSASRPSSPHPSPPHSHSHDHPHSHTHHHLHTPSSPDTPL